MAPLAQPLRQSPARGPRVRRLWATINPPRPGGVREQTTRERWNKIHRLLGQGVGLLDCSRHTADPAVPVTHLLQEIRALGYTGSANLLVRYLNQGRAEGDRPVTTARHASRLLLTDPENLRPKETTLLEKIATACPQMTALADLVRGFAALLKPAVGNDVKLTEWITTARAVNLPHLHSFTNGLELDRAAVDGGLTWLYHNGRTEGVNTRTKRIMSHARTRRIRPPPPPNPPALTATRCHHRLRARPKRLTVPRAVLVYRESMASPTIVDYREVTHIDSCRI